MSDTEWMELGRKLRAIDPEKYAEAAALMRRYIAAKAKMDDAVAEIEALPTRAATG